MQAVAGLARVSVADPVGQYDEVAAGIERLSGSEQFAGEFGAHQAHPAAAGTVQDQHGVAHHPMGILARGAKGAVMDAQLRQRLPGGEGEVPRGEIPLVRRRIGAVRLRGRGLKQHGDTASEEC